MKLNIKTMAIILILANFNHVYAADCIKQSAPSGTSFEQYYGKNCKSWVTAATYTMAGSGHYIGVSGCSACKAGYTATYPRVENCPNTSKFYMTCECICNNCNTNVIWSEAWGQAGYERGIGIVSGCDCSDGEPTCTYTEEYRCAAGYYGTEIKETWQDGIWNPILSGCTKCPTSNGNVGQSNAGSTKITNCYIQSGKTFSDNAGTGTYTSNCYYRN